MTHAVSKLEPRLLHIMKIADFVEREAGHVVVSLILIILGAALWILKVPKGEDLIPFATGVLARSMVGTKSNSTAPPPQ